MVLYFQYVIRCGNRFALCHVCVCDMGQLLSIFGSSAQARMCSDCFVVGCFCYWDILLVDVIVP